MELNEFNINYIKSLFLKTGEYDSYKDLLLQHKKYFAVDSYSNIIESLIQYLTKKLFGNHVDIYHKFQSAQFNSYNKDFLQSNQLRLLKGLLDSIIIYNDERRKKVTTKTYITASDIAQYSFCPISYSINKSFEILPSKAAQISTSFHQQSRLINQLKQSTKAGDEDSFWFYDNRQFFEEVNTSTIIFSGHIPDENKYFINKKFIGQPDYIFRKTDGSHFIVEEKFKHKKNSSDDYESESQKDSFYKNHELQVAAYIYGIKSEEIPQIDYGYILHWYYSYDDGKPYISGCKLKRINKSEKLKEKLITVWKEIEKVNDSIGAYKNIFKPENINLNKCSNCSVMSICVHKFGELKEFELPYYNNKFQYPFETSLPKELFRYKTAIDYYLSEKYPCQICRTWLEKPLLNKIYLKPISDNPTFFRDEFNNSFEQYACEIYDYSEGSNLILINYHKRYLIQRLFENIQLTKCVLVVDNACNKCRQEQTIQLRFS